MCFYHLNIIYPPYSYKGYAAMKRDTSMPHEVFCHGNILQGDKVAFATHVSRALKDFILENLQLNLFISQMMAKHHRNVQHLVKNSGYLIRDTFLCEQYMYNIVGKLVKDTYKKHENDVDNVHMWGRENPNLLFYY